MVCVDVELWNLIDFAELEKGVEDIWFCTNIEEIVVDTCGVEDLDELFGFFGECIFGGSFDEGKNFAIFEKIVEFLGAIKSPFGAWDQGEECVLGDEISDFLETSNEFFAREEELGSGIFFEEIFLEILVYLDIENVKLDTLGFQEVDYFE